MNKTLTKSCLSSGLDKRDYSFDNHKLMSKESNTKDDLFTKDLDLRDEFMPPIFNQMYGSCTCESTVASYWYQVNRLWNQADIKNDEKYSRRFLYCMARYLNGNLHEDNGSTLRNACKALHKYGVATISNDNNDMDFDVLPNFYALAQAGNEKIDAYYRMGKKNRLIQILTALDNKIPVIISTNIDKFRDAKYHNGLSRNSLKWDKKIGQGHAMLIVGRLTNFDYYGTKMNVFVIRNSWGDNFGDKGYCYIPETQMIKYGIDEAWIVIKNDFEEDMETENYKIHKYGKEKDIPVDSIVYEHEGYSNEYLIKLYHEDIEKYNQIHSKFKDLNKLFLSNNSGRWKNFRGKPTKIEFPIEYIDKYGQKFIIE